MLDLKRQEATVVLSPVEHHPREGWAEAAKALANADDGEPAWPQIDTASDDDWRW